MTTDHHWRHRHRKRVGAMAQKNSGQKEPEEDDQGTAVAPDLPIVTVFGAGVAGLSAAHELIERGFRVQVVESRASQFEEYECQVGGLAANQHSRVPAPVETLHGRDYRKRYSHKQKQWLAKIRSGELEEAQPRFPMLQRIRFDRATHAPFPTTDLDQDAGTATVDRPPRTPYEPAGDIPGDWYHYWDEHGVLNETKLSRVLDTLKEAYDYYSKVFIEQLHERVSMWWNLIEARTDPDLSKGGAQGEHAEWAIREVLYVRVIGFTDSDGEAEENRRIAQVWAAEVKKRLVALNENRPEQAKIPDLDQRLVVEGNGSANPEFDQSTALGRSRSNRVEFEVVEQIIPGEHGFRFFPNFYRHIFDTMRRTPMLSRDYGTTGDTAYDQLVDTPGALLALADGQPPIPMHLRRILSVRQLQEALDAFINRIGFTAADMMGMQYFMMRYMTSCPARRQKEAEPINFIEYIGGKDLYSNAAWTFVNNAPRALAAMSATESDARTQFDIVIQMMGLHPEKEFISDKTLNGPTDLAWLDHWKRYLKTQGVQFFTGGLERIRLDETDKQFYPEAIGPEGCGMPRPEDPYQRYEAPTPETYNWHRTILASSYQTASNLVWDAYHQAMEASVPFSGPFRQLVEFDRKSGRRGMDGKLLPIPRDPRTGAQLGDTPLRTISGLQFFFPNMYRIGDGNIYFPDSPWGLTSISQFAYWRDRVRPVGRFLGQISVDVGDWHTFYPSAGSDEIDYGKLTDQHGHPAWHSSAPEVARKTWDQVKDGLDLDLSKVMMAPRYYHIDTNIVFSEGKPLGFRGNMVFRISPNNTDSPDEPYEIGFRLSISEWSTFPPVEPLAQTVRVEAGKGRKPLEIAKAFVEQINTMTDKNYGRIAFAVLQEKGLMALPPTDGDKHKSPSAASQAPEILVSPYTAGKAFGVRARGSSPLPFYMAVDGSIHRLTFTYTGDGEQRAWKLDADPPLPKYLTATEPAVLGEDDMIAFEIMSKKSASIGVANRSGLIEIVDGADLIAKTVLPNVQVIHQPPRPSGHLRRIASRGNAVVSFEKTTGNGTVPPEQHRTYALEFDVQNDVRQVSLVPKKDQTWPQLRDEFLKEIQDKHGDVAIVRPFLNLSIERVDLLNTPHAENPAPPQIVLSSIVNLERAMISVASDVGDNRYNGEFIIHVDGCEVSVDGSGLSEEALRDKLFAALVEAKKSGRLESPEGRTVEIFTVGKGGIGLQAIREGMHVGPKSPTLKVGVLNVGRQIEMVGAPPIRVAVKDLRIEMVNEALVPIRNDGEFLINKPGQWQYRPGLFDMRDDVHVSEQESVSDDTDIFYAHSNCHALRNWVGAGTYMATHTRMTTMEAANESARHAVSAILHDLMMGGMDGKAGTAHTLPADFPTIWNPERNEPEDLDYWKELDEELCRQGLPHAFDILSITETVKRLLAMKVNAPVSHGHATKLTEIVAEGVMAQLKAFNAVKDMGTDLHQRHASEARGMLQNDKGLETLFDGIRQLLELAREMGTEKR